MTQHIETIHIIGKDLCFNTQKAYHICKQRGIQTVPDVWEQRFFTETQAYRWMCMYKYYTLPMCFVKRWRRPLEFIGGSDMLEEYLDSIDEKVYTSVDRAGMM
jgi:hypothetical protein